MAIAKQVCCSVLVLVLWVCLVSSRSARSPCPGVFNYEQDESGIYGKIIIKPGAPTSQLEVQTSFTVTTRLFSNYYGTLEQVNERFALQNYNQGSPMVFRVTFPVTSPLPRVTGITVNGRTICAGPRDTLRPNGYITTFSLKHTSFFQGGGQSYPPVQPNYPSNVNDDYNSQDTLQDVNPSTYPSYNPIKPAYETTRRPDPIEYPVEDYETPEPVTTKRPVQIQTRPQTYTECGTRSSSLDTLALIYGGEDYQRGDQPWLVAIYKTSGTNLNFKCGGSLVSNRHVITAAHCMWLGSERSAVKDMVVKLGVHRLSDWEDDLVVTRSLIEANIHEKYDSTSFKNDILVMTLSKEVKFSTYIRPACLWDGNNALEQIVGSSGVVAGWGEQSKRGGAADQPQLVHLPIVRTEKCRSSKETFINLTSDKTFCAGDRTGVGPCRGDSGGGMYLLDGAKWKLRGIVSVSLRGPDGSCNLDEYIVFTDIAQYLPWIYKVLSKKNFD